MGLLDWLFSSDLLTVDQRYRRDQSNYNARVAYDNAVRAQDQGRQQANTWPLGTPTSYTPRLGWHPTPPPKPLETHKTRMARLIARRQERNAR